MSKPRVSFGSAPMDQVNIWRDRQMVNDRDKEVARKISAFNPNGVAIEIAAYREEVTGELVKALKAADSAAWGDYSWQEMARAAIAKAEGREG